MRVACRPKARWRYGLAGMLPALMLLSVHPPFAAASWTVPEADWRYELTLERVPTHAAAGYFAVVPDGGTLPGPAPVTHVFTESGRALDSYVLWHNPAGDLGFVFADPGGGRVRVYVTGEPSYRLWRPESGLRPSPILSTASGRGTMSAARPLGMLGRVSENVHFQEFISRPRSPLSIAGDPSGRPRPSAFFLLAHVVTREPGRTWIAPMSADGDTEVHINGQRIAPRRRNDLWGGRGQWVVLEEGLQRVEVYSAAPAPEERGHIMFLAWRTPQAVIEYDNAEARPVRMHELVRSGSVSLDAVCAREAIAPAIIKADPREVFWFEDETPLIVFHFEALREGHPGEIEYLWQFEDGGRFEGPSVRWVLPAGREHRVRLETRTPTGRSAMVRRVFGFSTHQTSLDNALHRRSFREALSHMLQAYPQQPDPTAQWDPAIWKNLVRTLDFGRGYPLFVELFEKRSATMRARLTDNQVAALQEIFLDQAPRVDPREALAWIQRLHADTRDTRRRGQLEIRAAEIHMYYLDDLAAAREGLAAVARSAAMPEEIVSLARIRLGDAAFLAGDLSTATRYYGEEHENAARRGLAPMEGMLELLQSSEPIIAEPGRVSRRLGTTAGRADHWQLNALWDAALSENIQGWIEEGRWLEARQALNVWERDLPLAKISADYFIQEARLYRAAGDSRRALTILQAYCEHMDAAAYLPAAGHLLLGCMQEMEKPTEDIRAAGEMLLNKLEFHPAADRIRFVLDRLP